MSHATRILFVVSLATLMLPDAVHAQGQRGGGIRGPVDPRVQQRTSFPRACRIFLRSSANTPNSQAAGGLPTRIGLR